MIQRIVADQQHRALAQLLCSGSTLNVKAARVPHHRRAQRKDQRRIEIAQVVKYQEARSCAWNILLPINGAMGQDGKQEVDDIAQETALKAFTSLDQFRQEGRFQTWVTSIAVNEVRQFLRSSRSHRLESLDTAYTDSQSESLRKIDLIQTQERPATECVFHGQVNELLRKALGRLPERLRAIVILRDLEET